MQRLQKLLDSKKFRITLVSVMLLGFIVTVVIVFANFLDGLNKRQLNLTAPSANQQDYVQVNITIIKVDPLEQELVAEFTFLPFGVYLDQPTQTLSRDLRMALTGTNTKSEFDFPKGRSMFIEDKITLRLNSGDVNTYPLDEHSVTVSLAIYEPNTPILNDKGEFNTLSQRVRLIGNTPGFVLTVTPYDVVKEKDKLPYFIITANRITSVKIFAFFIVLMLWILGIICVWQACTIWIKDRELASDYFSFYAAIIFAIPSLRATLPGNPPYGSLIDFLGFYWAIGLAVFALVLIFLIWLARKDITHTEPVAERKFEEVTAKNGKSD
jgi:Domain of unknown function (DUF4436)